MDVAFAKLVLDILKESRSVINKRKKKDDPIGLGSLLRLYGSGKKHVGLLEQYLTGIDQVAQEFDEGEAEQIDDIIQEIYSFGLALSEVNLHAIDLFHPALGKEIGRIVGMDTSLLSDFNHYVVPKFGLDKRKIPKIVSLYVENFQGPQWRPESKGILNIFRRRRWYGYNKDYGYDKDTKSRSDVITQLKEILSLIKKCNELIGEIIRENWSFKEILDIKEA